MQMNILVAYYLRFSVIASLTISLAITYFKLILKYYHINESMYVSGNTYVYLHFKPRKQVVFVVAVLCIHDYYGVIIIKLMQNIIKFTPVDFFAKYRLLSNIHILPLTSC